jgi:hypothetical protein
MLAGGVIRSSLESQVLPPRHISYAHGEKRNRNQFLRLLGQIPHDIPVLVAARLLKPLGNPHQTA